MWGVTFAACVVFPFLPPLLANGWNVFVYCFSTIPLTDCRNPWNTCGAYGCSLIPSVRWRLSVEKRASLLLSKRANHLSKAASLCSPIANTKCKVTTIGRKKGEPPTEQTSNSLKCFPRVEKRRLSSWAPCWMKWWTCSPSSEWSSHLVLFSHSVNPSPLRWVPADTWTIQGCSVCFLGARVRWSSWKF